MDFLMNFLMIKYREKTVNTKSTHLDYGPTIGEMRMSRLGHPRATMVAAILLAVVFLLFGMFASAIEPGHAAAPNTINGAVALIGDWILHCTHA
jgi:hypothetical protein